MKRLGLIFAVIFTLSASDDPQLDLAIRAQTAFDKLVLAGAPQLTEAQACIQAQAALLPVATPQNLPLLHFRKAFCTLAEASLTHDSAEFLAAAGEFDAAKVAWQAMPIGKKEQPLPVPLTVQVLAVVARLETAPTGAALEPLRQQLDAATRDTACDSYVISTELCHEVVRLSDLWRARLAAQSGDWQTANALFTYHKARGWADWSRGRSEFQSGDYPAAQNAYQAAITAWRSAQTSNLPLLERLEPQPDFSSALADLGGAQIVNNAIPAAVATLSQAVKADPRDSRALYLRGRAKEVAGQPEAALDDFNLASRTAFGDENDAAVADGHFYRGILLYRSKQFTRAENEFSAVLNSNSANPLRPDATAWKRLSAVAGGACGASRGALEQSLSAVSPFFPAAEARAAVAACDASNPLN